MVPYEACHRYVCLNDMCCYMVKETQRPGFFFWPHCSMPRAPIRLSRSFPSKAPSAGLWCSGLSRVSSLAWLCVSVYVYTAVPRPLLQWAGGVPWFPWGVSSCTEKISGYCRQPLNIDTAVLPAQSGRNCRPPGWFFVYVDGWVCVSSTQLTVCYYQGIVRS